MGWCPSLCGIFLHARGAVVLPYCQSCNVQIGATSLEMGIPANPPVIRERLYVSGTPYVVLFWVARRRVLAEKGCNHEPDHVLCWVGNVVLTSGALFFVFPSLICRISLIQFVCPSIFLIH